MHTGSEPDLTGNQCSIAFLRIPGRLNSCHMGASPYPWEKATRASVYPPDRPTSTVTVRDPSSIESDLHGEGAHLLVRFLAKPSTNRFCRECRLRLPLIAPMPAGPRGDASFLCSGAPVCKTVEFCNSVHPASGELFAYADITNIHIECRDDSSGG